MKVVFFLFIILLLSGCSSQNGTSGISDIHIFQRELNEEYLDSLKTPLRGQNYSDFTSHPFFPINKKFRVNAEFTVTPRSTAFQLSTSSGLSKTYKAYGKVKFKIDGKAYSLTVYQSQDLMKKAAFADYLFLPFHDLTNGHETYGGGKYIDLKIPKGDSIIVDFNQSYQPFCAYNAYDYSCPIVPEENRLPIRIEAGVKYLNTYFEH